MAHPPGERPPEIRVAVGEDGGLTDRVLQRLPRRLHEVAAGGLLGLAGEPSEPLVQDGVQNLLHPVPKAVPAAAEPFRAPPPAAPVERTTALFAVLHTYPIPHDL